MARRTGRSGLTGAVFDMVRPVWPVACGGRAERVAAGDGYGIGGLTGADRAAAFEGVFRRLCGLGNTQVAA